MFMAQSDGFALFINNIVFHSERHEQKKRPATDFDFFILLFCSLRMTVLLV